MARRVCRQARARDRLRAGSTYGYDNADRLTSVVNASGTPFSSFTYTLDAGGGDRIQMVDSLGVNSYTLDNLYRLTSVTYPGGERRTIR